MPEEPAVPLPYTGFEVVRRGYNQAQVDEHLRRLDAEIRILATDREAAIDQSMQLTRELDDSRARAERLRAQVRTLVNPQQSVQGMTERMRSMLRLAEDEVGEMLMRAETEVNKRVSEADQRAARVLAEARAEADEIGRNATADAGRTRQECEARRAELATEAKAHAERLAADIERAQQEQAAARAALGDERRTHVEVLATRSAEADREIAEARSRLEADRRAHQEAVDAADAAADRRRSEAWIESEAKRALVEEDFQIAMDQRRHEALAALRQEQEETRRSTDELRERAGTEAAAITAAAEATAVEIVGEARRRVAEARELRGLLADQLGGARGRLDAVIDALRREPAPAGDGGDRPTAPEPATTGPATTSPAPPFDDAAAEPTTDRPAESAVHAGADPSVDGSQRPGRPEPVTDGAKRRAADPGPPAGRASRPTPSPRIRTAAQTPPV